MWHSGRRLSIARSWQLAKRAYASVVEERDELLRQLYWTQDQLREITAEVRELKAVVLARQHAETELAARCTASVPSSGPKRPSATRQHRSNDTKVRRPLWGHAGKHLLSLSLAAFDPDAICLPAF
jgi:hypothetical protein